MKKYNVKHKRASALTALGLSLFFTTSTPLYGADENENGVGVLLRRAVELGEEMREQDATDIIPDVVLPTIVNYFRGPRTLTIKNENTKPLEVSLLDRRTGNSLFLGRVRTHGVLEIPDSIEEYDVKGRLGVGRESICEILDHNKRTHKVVFLKKFFGTEGVEVDDTYRIRGG